MKCLGWIRGIVGFFLFAFVARGQMTDVLTYHNDNARTGQALHEEILTPANVNTGHFGLLRTLAVDGKVDAEPLYAAGVPIPGVGLRNILLVVTEHDSVYAFNADGTNIYWKVSMLGSGETTSDTRGCSQVSPEIGITATPVIDRQFGSNGTVFLVAMSKNGSAYFQRLHALDLATGADRLAPVAVAATFPGLGDNHVGANVVFDPKQYKERCGLLLLDGVIYTAWASHCDIRPYTGWVIGYDEQTLAQTSVLNITPNGNEAAFWSSGAGMAADTNGNIYALAGNGTFETNLVNGFPNSNDFGNSFLKFSTTARKLGVADYFCMSNTVSESGVDADLGSGGALVLPDMTDGSGQVRQLAVGAGKDSIIYLVDRANLGQFHATTNAIWQQVNNVISGGLWSMPAYFNGFLYFGGVGDRVKAFPFQNARLGARSSETASAFAYPGCTPGVSANGAASGILWATENTAPLVLHAYNATNLNLELYNSNQAGSRDHSGSGNKFITPMIASARVYVGTTAGVGVFGLLNDSTLTPLQGWRDTNFGNPSNVGAGADGAAPAGDGVPNLVKYALGLNPLTTASTNQLPSGSLQSDAGEKYLTLTVPRTAVAPDVSYVVEVSGDLTNWFSGGTNTFIVTNTATELVVRDTTPVENAGELFIRLVVTSP
ncbi:MAG TPA: pyrrolo-quinoline quinone [Verrucomicrobiae bacterium]|jgi:hypothetical protein|nr:pyrrolo-quinoline quinone [Verrucomicrobiae bacterium]